MTADFVKVFGKYQSPCVLPLVLSGCQGDQLPTVLRGQGLAQPDEIGKLCDLAVNEAAEFNSLGVLEYFLEDRVLLKPWLLQQAMRTASTHGSQSALALLVNIYCTRFAFRHGLNDILADAVREGQTELVRYLIDCGIDQATPQVVGEAFLCAASKEYIPILEILAPLIQDYESYQTDLDRALTSACVAGLSETAQFLVKQGANINTVLKTPPLRWGSRNNMVGRLMPGALDYPNSLQHRDRYSKKGVPPVTPLQACLEVNGAWWGGMYGGEISAQHELVLNLLVEHGADINSVSAHGRPLFHTVVKSCTPNTVRNFIAHGADIHSKASDKSTALDTAVGRELGTLPVVRDLLEAGATIPIELDGEHRRCVILDRLLDFFPSHTRSDKLPQLLREKKIGQFDKSKSLQQVLSTGPGAVIKLLLLHEPKLRATDTRYGLLLQMIAVMGEQSFLELLIQRGVDVNLSGYYYGDAIQAAARHGRLECVNLLLSAGSEVDRLGGAYGTALRAAVVAENQEIVDLLISHGADVNSPSQEAKKTSARVPPLQLAIQTGNIMTTRSLLVAGANVKQKPYPLLLAVEMGNLQVVEMLLDFEVQANPQSDVNVHLEPVAGFDDKENEKVRYTSALHTACAKGLYEIAQLLLKHGVYPDKNDRQHKTALAIAASAGHIEIVELVLEFGAHIYQPAYITYVLTEALKGK